MNSCRDNRVAVIGGGVSGVAAAHYLLKHGLSVDLYEAGPRLGGRVCIDELNEEEVCFGGKNIGLQYTEFRRFLRDYGNPEFEYFGINSARLEKDKVKTFNSQQKVRSFMTLLQTAKLSDLKKAREALKAVKSDRRNGDLCAPYFTHLTKRNPVSLTSHFSSKFSQAFLRALTVRMNGAEPHEIALENFGTHLQMLQDEYEQLSSPLSLVFESFAKAKRLELLLKTSVHSLTSTPQGFNLGTQKGTRHYRKVIIAVAASQAAALLKDPFPKISNALRQVRYYPVGVIVADYAQNVFAKDVRALTFGRDSPVSNIGAYGIHHLNRVRYTFSGEVAADVLHEAIDERALLNIGEEAGHPFFNLDTNPCHAFKLKYWPHGLCGYTQNEAAFQAQLNSALRDVSGLFLTGDYRKGASIENCFRAAKSTVNLVLSQAEPHTSAPSSNWPDKEIYYVEN